MSTETTISVNGTDEPIENATTLSALLRDKGVELDSRGIAVALNGKVVNRAAWRQTPVKAGDAVEIVQAKQGG